MKRKSKKQQPNSAMTAFAALLVTGLIATTVATYMSPDMPDYDFEAHRNMIKQLNDEPKPVKLYKPKPVKLYRVKEPKRTDDTEAKLTYLFLYGNDKESAKARQLLANK